MAAGGINAIAGGGTLVSFPTLVALGVPAVSANVTNTVSLVPGYLTGSWAQRDDLRPQFVHARALAGVAAAGALGGSVLLLAIPVGVFRLAIPYLILFSCALLFFQDRLKSATPLAGPPPGTDSPTGTTVIRRSPTLFVLVFLAAIYGGFFGAGLSIMLLAVLGLFSYDPLAKVNALKQALAFVINLVAAVFFAFSGRVVWELVPVMAAGSMLGGFTGGRLVTVIDSTWLRRLVVVAGVAVAISFWVA